MALDGGADLVLLAHHRRDQAETFLLQALRGGGVAALAAMPKLARRENVTWARPWLDRPREAIEAYVRRHRLRPVDDDSNDDVRFARNRLRLNVWPDLLASFPDAEASLASAAQWAQGASAGLDELAVLDLSVIVSADAFDIATWRSLSPARQANALRAWLRQRLGKAAPATLVLRLLGELDEHRSLRWPAREGELRSYRGRLRYAPALPTQPSALPTRVDLSCPGIHELSSWHGAFRVVPVTSGGLALTTARRLELRARCSGDRFQAGANRPPRSLKLQYQMASVPAWQRDGPIVYHEGRLVFVPGLGLDARSIATASEPQVSLAWRFD